MLFIFLHSFQLIMMKFGSMLKQFCLRIRVALFEKNASKVSGALMTLVEKECGFA